MTTMMSRPPAYAPPAPSAPPQSDAPPSYDSLRDHSSSATTTTTTNMTTIPLDNSSSSRRDSSTSSTETTPLTQSSTSPPKLSFVPLTGPRRADPFKVEIRGPAGVTQIYPKPKNNQKTKQIQVESIQQQLDRETTTTSLPLSSSSSSSSEMKLDEETAKKFHAHKVHPSDTLDGLAVRYNTTVSQIRRYNRRIVFDTLDNVFGDTIFIPRNGEVGIAPVDPKLEEERIKKEKMRAFLFKAGHDCHESEAMFYLDENAFDLDKAWKQYQEDKEWEKVHPNPQISSKMTSQQKLEEKKIVSKKNKERKNGGTEKEKKPLIQSSSSPPPFAPSSSFSSSSSTANPPPYAPSTSPPAYPSLKGVELTSFN